jgi:hypothetical protein
MEVICPTCAGRVAMDDVNVARDLALCRACERTFSFADAVCVDSSHDVPPEPPCGSWFEETFEGFRVGASTRSWAALFIVPFTLFWAGGSMGGLYGSQIVEARFNLLATLFGIPFLLGSVALVSFSLMLIFGRVAATVASGEGDVFTGVGPIGWRRRFDWGTVREAIEITSSHGRNGEPSKVIRLTGSRPFNFGSMLNESRRSYILAVLRHELRRRGKPGPWLDE